MAKRGGFPGGGMPGNMSNLMKQAQRMQRQMEEQQKEMETKEFIGKAGGGAVTVSFTGKREMTKIEIDPELVDPDDIDTLQLAVMAAVNEGLRQIEEANNNMVNQMTGGMNLGGLSF
ncbi:MAG: YbaB/EbfC family nucleoid-associated protein [Lachnospiraceae bacterium]|nr:YbaB/EbfC family nucleoid-associated protein [Lachnospiraceae bacterium]